MINPVEINGIVATSVLSALGYSADQRGVENSILYGVKEVLKGYEVSIPYTQEYFYEEFWFYYTTAVILNTQFPILQFNIEHQLTAEEIAVVSEQSIFNSMQSLSFIIPFDRANILGINSKYKQPTEKFERETESRRNEYFMLLNKFENTPSIHSHAIENDPQYNLNEYFINRYFASLRNESDIALKEVVVRQAFQSIITSKLVVFNTTLKDYILNNRK